RRTLCLVRGGVSWVSRARGGLPEARPGPPPPPVRPCPLCPPRACHDRRGHDGGSPLGAVAAVPVFPQGRFRTLRQRLCAVSVPPGGSGGSLAVACRAATPRCHCPH